MKRIENIVNLLIRFGIDPDLPFEDANARLSRRVYKSTDCGAWARFEEPGLRSSGSERWICSCRFYKLDGVWTRGNLERDGVAVEWSTVPAEVRDYFWIDGGVGVGEWLDETYPGRVDVTCEATVDVRTWEPHGGVFVIGSIVEGSDAEVWPIEVYLPCEEEEIDRAISDVESEADRLWREANADPGGMEESDLVGEVER